MELYTKPDHQPESSSIEILKEKGKQELASKTKSLGILGKLLGDPAHAKANGGIFLALVFASMGFTYTIIPQLVHPNFPPEKLWTVITPLITLCIGYSIGDNSAK